MMAIILRNRFFFVQSNISILEVQNENVLLASVDVGMEWIGICVSERLLKPFEDCRNVVCDEIECILC